MPIDFKDWDNRFFADSERIASNIDKLYADLVAEVTRLAGTITPDPDTMFAFSDHPKISKKVKALFRQFAQDLQDNIEIGYGYAFEYSGRKHDSFIKALSKQTGIPQSVLGLSERQNLKAVEAFQARKAQGIELSGRVWKIGEQAQKEIEMALDLGLAQGKSAAALSRDVRKDLNDPGNLFRRIRNKRGNLVPSRAAAAFSPGRGVYRSSYKNAARLTRTEINMAYREADFTRWQALDFVVGIEVGLSNNPRHCPTCEALVGKYPKDFKFIGWHPQCRCMAIPVLFTDKEFEKWQRMQLQDSDEEIDSKREVTDLPDQAKEWFEENKKRLNQSSSTPYFLKKNEKYFKNIGR